MNNSDEYRIETEEVEAEAFGLFDSTPITGISTRSEYNRDNLPLVPGLLPHTRQRRERAQSLPSRPPSLDDIDERPENDGEGADLVWDHNADYQNLQLDDTVDNRQDRNLSTSTFHSVEIMDLPARQRLTQQLEIYEDDFDDYDVNLLSVEVLQRDLPTLEKLRDSIRNLMLELSVNEADYYSGIKDDTTEVKNKIVSLIKAAKVKISTQPQNAAPAAGSRRLPSTNVVSFNTERVNREKPETISRMVSQTGTIRELVNVQVKNDNDYFLFDEKVEAAQKRSDYLLKHASLLVNQAVIADMNTEASEIDKEIANLNNALDDLLKKKVENKTSLGLGPLGQSEKLLKLELPKFSGKIGGTDFFTFKKRFEDYNNLVRLSASKQLHVLKNDCIINESLRLSLSRFETTSEVWKYLMDTFGDVRAILQQKKLDVLRHGRFPWVDRSKGNVSTAVMKQRDWLLDLDSKLREVQALAVHHDKMNDNCDHQNQLYYGDLAVNVENMFPESIKDEFHKKLAESGKNSQGKEGFILFQEYLTALIDRFTVKANHLATSIEIDKKSGPSVPKDKPKERTNFAQFYSESDSEEIVEKLHLQKVKKGKKSEKKVNKKTGKKGQKIMVAAKSEPKIMECPSDGCKQSHTHLFYCKVYQDEKDLAKRLKMASNVFTCMRCLRLDSKVNFKNRIEWWEGHKENCQSDFICEAGYCKDKKPSSQKHFTLCASHSRANESRQEDFIKSLDQRQLGPSPSFFTFIYLNNNVQDDLEFEEENDVESDVKDPGIFLLHNIKVEGKELLVFYDSGAGGAAISNRAYKYLDAANVRPGPTLLNVAGGSTVAIDGGDESFYLDLDESHEKRRARFTALKMSNITIPFPRYEISEVWKDVVSCYNESGCEKPLPSPPKEVGGVSVDILVGIKYLQRFPEELFSLACGLVVYKAKLKCSNNHQAVLGGPHRAWRNAEESMQHISPMMFLTMEAKAYYFQTQTLRSVMSCKEEKMDELHDEEFIIEDLFVEDDAHSCPPVCENGALNQMFTFSTLKTDLSNAEAVDQIGGSNEYRCPKCRCCTECKRGDHLEMVSLNEEKEQALIEAGLRYDKEEKAMYTKLPFIKSPEEHLRPNQKIAEKVFLSQKKLCAKNPDMVDDLVRAHAKLEDGGYVVQYDSLDDSKKYIMTRLPRVYNFIPWRPQYKVASVSTPCRLVYDASSRTPGGESLNSVLATGRNLLSNLYQILLRFRKNRIGLCGDVKMAYNQVRLEPEYYKYQQYLWQKNLSDDEPIVVMVIITLIYGVRCASNIMIAAFHFLGREIVKDHPEVSTGADILARDSYMDDICSGATDVEKAEKVSSEIDFILGEGSMAVKVWTMSGKKPSELVSSDGKFIGLLGYLWEPETDMLMLDKKEIYLHKFKRGRPPPPVTGNFVDALKPVFTKRTLARMVASVFDPLGVMVPITAGLRLDLHEVMMLHTDWDVMLPERLLPKWGENMARIKELRLLKFRRVLIPEDAESLNIQLIVSCDASKDIAIAAVHSKIKLRTGGYSVRLFTAKSKLISSNTIPRAELKSARIAACLSHVARLNLGEVWQKTTFVTDSQITLYWINSDQRPLNTLVRNAVVEIRRFSRPDQWFHVSSENNVADIGTRPLKNIADVGLDSIWQNGKEWMYLEDTEMPIKSLAQIKLSEEERREAALETKVVVNLLGDSAENENIEMDDNSNNDENNQKEDIRDNTTNDDRDTGVKIDESATKDTTNDTGKSTKDLEAEEIMKVAARYRTSNFMPDPVAVGWGKCIKLRGWIMRYKSNLKKSLKGELKGGVYNPALIELSEDELIAAENYYFKLATKEVKKYVPAKQWKDFSVETEGILYYKSRILDGQAVSDVEKLFADIEPLSFCRPLVDRYSPLAYAIMIFVHEQVVYHRNSSACVQGSRSIGFIIGAKDLADIINEKCPSCRKHRAKTLQVEMGPIHQNRLTIASVFYNCQVDLMGPIICTCEHNHRSSVKAYGLIFKCTSTLAVSAHCMQKYDSDAFLAAFVRFSTRYSYPKKLFIDPGSQLLKSCKEMEIAFQDLVNPVKTKYQVGIEFQECPAGAHNSQGQVERSILEIKRMMTRIYGGVKLDLLNLETALLFISNELNNLPICLGKGFTNYTNLDIITPSRLIHGRNNQRAPKGLATFEKPGRLMQQLEDVKRGWWDIWRAEAIGSLIPGNKKWTKNWKELAVGDIVIFKIEENQLIKSTDWKYGVIDEVILSKDFKCRRAVIKYKNSTENKFRTTTKSVRSIAIIKKEDELSIYEMLTKAANET